MEPVGKKRERDSRAAKETILRAAEKIFARDGFGAARVDAIAALSGYNKSLIFQYFVDKLGLYRAVVQVCKDQSYDELIETMLFAMDNPDALTEEGFRRFLETAIRKHYDFLLAHPSLVRIQAWEAAEGWVTFNLFNPSPEKQSYMRLINEYLRKVRDVGIIRPEIETARLIAIMLGSCMYYILSLPRYQNLFPETDFASPEALTQAREQIISIVLRGILAQPKETSYAAQLSLASNNSDSHRAVHGDPRQHDRERSAPTDTESLCNEL